MTQLCACMPLSAYLGLSTITLETGRNHIWTVSASLSLSPFMMGNSLKEKGSRSFTRSIQETNQSGEKAGWDEKKKGGQIWEYSENQLALKGEGGNMPVQYCSCF